MYLYFLYNEKLCKYLISIRFSSVQFCSVFTPVEPTTCEPNIPWKPVCSNIYIVVHYIFLKCSLFFLNIVLQDNLNKTRSQIYFKAHKLTFRLLLHPLLNSPVKKSPPMVQKFHTKNETALLLINFLE